MSNLYKFVVTRVEMLEDGAKSNGDDFLAFIDDLSNDKGKLAPSFIVSAAINNARFWSKKL